MRKATATIDISGLPELLRLAEEVRASGEPRLLTRGGQEVALLTPIAPPKPSPEPAKPKTKASNIFGSIIGIADSAGSPDDPTDVAENKYKYLADAYDIKG